MKENIQKPLLRSSDDLIAAVEEYGFLPFFKTRFPASLSKSCAHLSCGLRMMWTVRGNGKVLLRGAASVSTARFSTRKLAS